MHQKWMIKAIIGDGGTLRPYMAITAANELSRY